MTREEAIRIRLKGEYEQLMAIPANDIMTVEPAPGEDIPYVRNYIVTYNIPTYVDEGRTLRQTTRVHIELGGNFPFSAPFTFVADGPVPFHMNWWITGELAQGSLWNVKRRLYEYLGYVGQMLQYHPARINANTPANTEALAFYKDNPDLFPTDTRPMPCPAGNIEPSDKDVVIPEPEPADHDADNDLRLRIDIPGSRSVTCSAPLDMLAKEIIDQFIERDLLAPDQEDWPYCLTLKSKDHRFLDMEKTLAENGIEDNDILEVLKLYFFRSCTPPSPALPVTAQK